MLFAANVDLMPNETSSIVTAQAEDMEQTVLQLPVEFVGKLPSFDAITEIVVRLPDGLPGGDVWVSISLRGVASNRALVSIRSPGVTPLNLVFDGDSLTAASTYPTETARLIGLEPSLSLGQWNNAALSGQTWTDMIARGPTAVDPLLVSGERNVVIAWEYANDLLGNDAGTSYYNMKTYCAARRAAGWTVIVFGALPRGTDPVFETQRQVVNTTMRAAFNVATPYSRVFKPAPGITYADMFVDNGADPTVGCRGCNVMPYFFDGVHLTPAGDRIIAAYVVNALRALP